MEIVIMTIIRKNTQTKIYILRMTVSPISNQETLTPNMKISKKVMKTSLRDQNVEMRTQRITVLKKMMMPYSINQTLEMTWKNLLHSLQMTLQTTNYKSHQNLKWVKMWTKKKPWRRSQSFMHIIISKQTYIKRIQLKICLKTMNEDELANIKSIEESVRRVY